MKLGRPPAIKNWDWLSKKLIQSKSGCLEFSGKKTRNGYGKIWFGSNGDDHKEILAHRLSWELNKGQIPDGMCVLHKCDNRLCCNPDHLFIGTRQDNTADMVSKGRQAKGDRHSSRTKPENLPHGIFHKHAKLTDEQVLEIRSRYANGESSQQIGREFNVSYKTIWAIGIGKSRKRLLHLS